MLAREAVLRPLARDLSSDVAQLLTSLIPGPSRREWNNPIPDRVDALLAYFREENPTGLRNRHFLAYCGEYYRADVTVAEA